MSILWPVDTVTVSQPFGGNAAYYAQLGQSGHNGIDIAVPAGTPVYATDAGVVDAEGWGQHDSWMGKPAGIFVRIRHAWGYSAVAHLSATSVDRGQAVARGQRIGTSGATGQAIGPHVHFEVFPTNPVWSNGFAGRIDPNTLAVVPRGELAPTIAQRPSGQKAGKTMDIYLGQIAPDTATIYVFGPKGYMPVTDIAHVSIIQRYIVPTGGNPLLKAEIDIVLNRYLKYVI